jgi:hypothetical protein
MTQISFIGDVHGKFDEYIEITKKHKFTLQLGDMGFDIDRLKKVNHHCHQFVPGNHESYDRILGGRCQHVANSLMATGHLDYGCFHFVEIAMYSIRGAESIDKHLRTEGVDWFANEQLTYSRFSSMVDNFRAVKPRIVVSHQCPSFVVKEILDAKAGDIYKYGKQFAYDITSQAMMSAWHAASVHPDLWVFGHHHCEFDQVIQGTRFVCVPELGVVTFDIKETEGPDRYTIEKIEQ